MKSFRDNLLLHLDAAYNLARWLTRNEADAKDVVQESFLRALKYSDTFKGDELKPWFLKIIRNTSFTIIKRKTNSQIFVPFDEDVHGSSEKIESPETQLLRSADINFVRTSLESLPVEYREVLILRELENLSYEEIAKVTETPLGTVMSRLSRGRTQLAEKLRRNQSED